MENISRLLSRRFQLEMRPALPISRVLPTVCGMGLVLALVNCAHSRDVRPGGDGTHRVVVRDHEAEAAERNALSQARHYCEQQGGKRPAILEDRGSTYTGSMDESTRKTIKQASTAAVLLGGGVATGPSVMGQAGQAGMVMTSGDDYVSEMKFRCE